MAKTIQEAAQTALDVQDACNLSGVLGAFRDVVFETLWPEARATGQGTDWVNKHPICTLFLDKLCSLNGYYGGQSEYSKAYGECKKLAEPVMTSDEVRQ